MTEQTRFLTEKEVRGIIERTLKQINGRDEKAETQKVASQKPPIVIRVKHG